MTTRWFVLTIFGLPGGANRTDGTAFPNSIKRTRGYHSYFLFGKSAGRDNKAILTMDAGNKQVLKFAVNPGKYQLPDH